jgi:hypothetical protein
MSNGGSVRVLVAFLALALSAVAPAHDPLRWHLIGHLNDGSAAYIDAQSLRGSRATGFRVWIKFLHPDSDNVTESSEYYDDINCKNGTYAELQSIIIRRDGSGSQYAAPAPRFEAPVPESTNEFVVNTLCK